MLVHYIKNGSFQYAYLDEYVIFCFSIILFHASVPVTYTSPGGRRVSSESAYLTSNVLGRPNLRVATHAHVTRILFDGTTAVGVEFANETTKTLYQAKAKKEVVLS